MCHRFQHLGDFGEYLRQLFPERMATKWQKVERKCQEMAKKYEGDEEPSFLSYQIKRDEVGQQWMAYPDTSNSDD